MSRVYKNIHFYPFCVQSKCLNQVAGINFKKNQLFCNSLRYLSRIQRYFKSPPLNTIRTHDHEACALPQSSKSELLRVFCCVYLSAGIFQVVDVEQVADLSKDDERVFGEARRHRKDLPGLPDQARVHQIDEELRKSTFCFKFAMVAVA